MNLTQSARDYLTRNLTYEDALPTQMPVYVNSVAYLFGVSALSALGMLIVSGLLLALFGPDWYHVSEAGHFVNSVHFWSVQVFLAAILLHLGTKFSMAAGRGERWETWMVGVLILGIAIFTGLTGYLSHTNWESQWIAVQSKDAMNAMGVGAFFNTMDTGQVLTIHVVVLPVVVGALVGLHLFLVRRDGPVKPLE